MRTLDADTMVSGTVFTLNINQTQGGRVYCGRLRCTAEAACWNGLLGRIAEADLTVCTGELPWWLALPSFFGRLLRQTAADETARPHY
jgi:hypothetical protein